MAVGAVDAASRLHLAPTSRCSSGAGASCKALIRAGGAEEWPVWSNWSDSGTFTYALTDKPQTGALRPHLVKEGGDGSALLTAAQCDHEAGCALVLSQWQATAQQRQPWFRLRVPTPVKTASYPGALATTALAVGSLASGERLSESRYLASRQRLPSAKNDYRAAPLLY